jgi:hypothetical protein
VRYCLATIRPAMRADVAQRRSSAEQLMQLGLSLLCNDAASYGLSACSVTSYERTQGSSRCCPPTMMRTAMCAAAKKQHAMRA